MAATARAVRPNQLADAALTPIVVPRAGIRRPLIAHVVPLVGLANDVFRLARAVIILADLNDLPASPTPDFVQRAFGLTPAEGRLASRLAAGETLADIAAAEKVSDRFISRTLRLAYLSPAVLEKLLLHRRPSAFSIKDLAVAAELPWAEQEKTVFDS